MPIPPADTLAALYGSDPAGVGVFDARGRFVYVNEALARINERPAAAHSGRDPVELLGPMVEAWLAAVSEVLATGRPVEHRLLSHPGSPSSFDASYHPVLDGGTVVGVVARVREATGDVGRVRRFAALAEIARSLAGIEHSPDAIAQAALRASLTLADRCILWRTSATGVHATSAGGFASDDLPSVLGQRVPLRADHPLLGKVARGETLRADRADGPGALTDVLLGPLDARAIVVPLMTRGELFGALQCSWSHPTPDRTEDDDAVSAIAAVVVAAIRRGELAEALERDRLQTVLDAMLDDVFIGRAVRDADGRIVDFRLVMASERVKDGAGRGVSELLDHSVLDLYPSWRASGIFHRFVQVVESRQPMSLREVHYVDETSAGPIDGWFSIEAVPFDDGYLAISRDVTSEVLERRLREDARVAVASERQAVELLQRIALPTRLPDLAGTSFAARYLPSDDTLLIGGDWYDAFPTADSCLALVVGDVAGHGRDAAVTMVDVRHFVAAAARDGRGPAEVLAQVAELAQRDDLLFTTCCIVEIDLAHGRLKAASAGHLPPVLVADGVPRLLEVEPGPPLGVGAAHYREVEVALAASSAVVLYTDGLVERRGELIDESLRRLASRVEGPWTPEELAERLIRGRARSDDDMCLLVCRIDLAEHAAAQEAAGGGASP